MVRKPKHRRGKLIKQGKPGEKVAAHITPLGGEVFDALEEQIELFRKKFGRDPLPEEPIFFDPAESTPVPYPPDRYKAEVTITMIRAGFREEIIYATLRTDRLPPLEEYMEAWSEEELEEWTDAIAEFHKTFPDDEGG